MMQGLLIFQTLLFCVSFSFLEASNRAIYAKPVYDTSLKHLFSNSRIRREFLGTFPQKSHPLVSSKVIDIDRNSWPQSKEKYDGTLTFMCKRQDGHFSLFELQSLSDFYPVEPLEIYADQFHSAQALKKNPKRIREVNRISISGQIPEQRVPSYHYHAGGMLFQNFCILGAPACHLTVEQKNWRAFFSLHRNTSESWVKAEIKTPIVRKAFDMMHLDNLPKEVKRQYLNEKTSVARSAKTTPST